MTYVPDGSASLSPHRLIFGHARWGSISCPGPAGWPTLSSHTSPLLLLPPELASATGELAPTSTPAGAAIRQRPTPAPTRLIRRRSPRTLLTMDIRYPPVVLRPATPDDKCHEEQNV